MINIYINSLYIMYIIINSLLFYNNCVDYIDNFENDYSKCIFVDTHN